MSRLEQRHMPQIGPVETPRQAGAGDLAREREVDAFVIRHRGSHRGHRGSDQRDSDDGGNAVGQREQATIVHTIRAPSASSNAALPGT